MEVLYEDNHLLIINKNAGEITQGDKTGDAPIGEAVKEYLKKKYDKPGNVFLGVVHRLDRPVSGILLFARTSKALERMSKMFREREIEKKYWAIVEKAPQVDSGTLVDYLLKNPDQNKSYVVSESRKGAKKASLSYKTLAQSDQYTLLEVDLHSGRHHQIRTQLANIGCIIKGDLKYGAKRSNSDGSIGLHARYLSFVHPVTQQHVQVEAPCNKKDALWAFFEEEVQKKL